MALKISNNVTLHESEVVITAVRAQGAGGQNVNKVSTAVHLRFDIQASSLPEFYKRRLLSMNDHRITREGILVIKVQEYRSQERNREAAFERLRSLIRSAAIVPKRRKPTKPTAGSKKRRLEGKAKRGKIKSLRTKVVPD